MLKATKVSLAWDSVPGTVEKWEIVQKLPDGSTVKSTAGARARTTQVLSREGVTTVTVNDLPGRKHPQVLDIEGKIEKEA